MTRTHFAAAAFAAAVVAAGCGGSNSTGPSSGGNNSGGGGGGSTNTTTITITSAGVSPKDITVAAGPRVTFVNNDSRPHEMNSDPHPEHTLCNPELNVGFIAAGQSGTTQNLNTARVCTYHDHNQPSNTSLQGTIRIQ
jgi:plastocyanin